MLVEACPSVSGYEPSSPAKTQVTLPKVANAEPSTNGTLATVEFTEHEGARSSNTDIPLALDMLEPTKTSSTVVASAPTMTTPLTRLLGVEVIVEGATSILDCPISLVGQS